MLYWLVEAMEKNSPSKKGQEREGPVKADELRLLPDSQKGTEAGGFAAVSAEATTPVEKDRKAIEPPPNPLNQFLASWMTPQDYALLKPGLETSSNTGPLAPTEAMLSVPSPAEISVATRSDLEASVRGADRSLLAPARPTENPYLQAFNEPVPFAGFTPPLPPIAAPSAPSPAPTIFVPPATPLPPPQSKVPDFAKPAVDDKYFKPLKRF